MKMGVELLTIALVCLQCLLPLQGARIQAREEASILDDAQESSFDEAVPDTPLTGPLRYNTRLVADKFCLPDPDIQPDAIKSTIQGFEE